MDRKTKRKELRAVRSRINGLIAKIREREERLLSALGEKGREQAYSFLHPEPWANKMARSIASYQSEMMYLMKVLQREDGDFKPPKAL